MKQKFTKEQLISLYEIQAADLRMRQSAIWNEVHHYTWVLSLIVGAPFLAYISIDDVNKSIIIFLTFSSAFGAVLAFFAMLIICKDFRYFTLSDSRLLAYEHLIGLTEIEELVDDRARRATAEDNFVAEIDAKKETKVSWKWVRELKMRFLILSVFFLYLLGSSAMAAYFACLLCNIK